MINRPQRVSMVKAPFHNRTFAKDAMEDRQLLFAVSVTAQSNVPQTAMFSQPIITITTSCLRQPQYSNTPHPSL